MRLLLVDDDANVVEGLERSLFDLDLDLDVETCTSGAAALLALRRNVFDVVITDVRMPGMDGADLLTVVHDRHPDVVRIVLSGQMDEATAWRTLPRAHQVMVKPCSSAVLQAALHQAAATRRLLVNETIRSAVGGLDRLPSVPTIVMELQRLLADDRTSDTALAQLIQSDASLSAKVLQLANSGYFRATQPLVRIDAALSRLGRRTLYTLVLVHAISELANGFPQITARIQRQGLDAAARVRTIDPHPDLFSAAVLADIGTLVVASIAPEKSKALFARRDAGEDSLVLEREIVGATHSEVGAYLLGLWGLPRSLVEVVEHHHQPQRAPKEHRRAAAIIHIACAHAEGRAVDEAALAAAGFAAEAPAWMERCAAIGQGKP